MNEDAIHYLLEKNDYLNGFQFFVDIASGWSTYAMHLKNYIMEECPKSSNIFIPVSTLSHPLTKKSVNPQYSYSNAITCLADWSVNCDGVLPINMHFSLEGSVRIRSNPYLYSQPRYDMRASFENDTDAGFFYNSLALLNMTRFFREKENNKVGGMRNFFEE